MASQPHYPIWCTTPDSANIRAFTKKEFNATIRALFKHDWPGNNEYIDITVQLIPEINNPNPWDIAIRCGGRTIGYMRQDEAREWATTVRRVVASGYVPTTEASVSAAEPDHDTSRLGASIYLSLGRADQALPRNNPPPQPFSMLPRSRIVQVVKEDQHPAVLKFVPNSGYAVLYATLREAGVQGRPHVEVLVDGDRIGQLSPPTGKQFLPLIRHLADHGFTTACWADITGSKIAAEVRINAAKAAEVSAEFLADPAAKNLYPLVDHCKDPRDYDLSSQWSMLAPVPPEPPPEPIPCAPEPPIRSAIRFDMYDHRYTYLATSQGKEWTTTAADGTRAITDSTTWPQLVDQLDTFEIATACSLVTSQWDPRCRQHRATLLFMVGGTICGAVNIDRAGGVDNWYTTISDHYRLPVGKVATLTEILGFARNVQIVTDWHTYPARGPQWRTRS